MTSVERTDEKTGAHAVLDEDRRFFETGRTRDVAFRLEQLDVLARSLLDYQDEIVKALEQDLRKPTAEAYASDLVPVFQEIKFARANLPEWSRPKRIDDYSDPFDVLSQGAYDAHIYPEPYGTALIIGPWNYPVQLLLNPLVGSIAAGNCSVLKPSEFAPETARVISTMMAERFDAGFLRVVMGEAETGKALIGEPFDYIFFTGGSSIGRQIMKAAAEHLTPVTLELGGKSPCIVDAEADLEKTAKRVVQGKLLNAGQTCVAPDYLLVHERVKKALVGRITATIGEFYGPNPQESRDLARIVNERHFDRLAALLDTGKVCFGGETDRGDLYIAPTLLDNVTWDDPIMRDEIFGPILPVLEYDDLDRAIRTIAQRPKPLALYVFSENEEVQRRVIEGLSYGGGCVNDTLHHETSVTLPFGGVGPSGMGSYHGKASFETFSHMKSVLRRGSGYDSSHLQPPFNELHVAFMKGLLES